jgi:hypothetical protein
VNPYTGDGCGDVTFATPPWFPSFFPDIWIDYKFAHVPPSYLVPAAPRPSLQWDLGIRYYRGICTAGSAGIGAPCNDATDCGTSGACSVTAATTDDTTRFSVVTHAGGDLVDFYRGTVVTAKGTRNGQLWLLNHPGGPVLIQTLSFVQNVPFIGKQYARTLNQTADPNPPVGAAQYYLAVGHAAGGTSFNALGCANPDVCGNAGWCTGSGLPCNGPGECGAGTCILRPTYCSTDGGTADLGGCSRHQVCAGGTNVGGLCLAAADCPGSTCPAIPASQDGVCYGIPRTQKISDLPSPRGTFVQNPLAPFNQGSKRLLETP